MAYVQGTSVRLTADFSDPATRAAIVPREVVVRIVPPVGEAIEATLSGGEIRADGGVAGRYVYVLDTSAAPGTWQYQFEAPDYPEAVVARKAITVTRRLGGVSSPTA